MSSSSASSGPLAAFVAGAERFLFSFRASILFLFAVLTIVSGYLASGLAIDAGFLKQLPSEHPYIETFSDYREKLPGANAVIVAVEAKATLEAKGVGTRVVSMPSWELFAQQDEAYRRKILPPGPVRIGIEAAVRDGGWDRWLLGERGREAKSGFIGMSSFGASAPAGELFEKFGITADATVAKAKELLG